MKSQAETADSPCDVKPSDVPASMFDDLSKRIKNVASKMDVILFGSVTKDKELPIDVVTLQCFHIAVFREPSPILMRFMERLDNHKPTAEQKKKKKDTGSFFTPPFIAEYMVKATLGPLVDKFQKGRKPTLPATKIRKLLRLRICDPAVGGGIFLVCAHDFLMTKILEADPGADLEKMSRESALCLFGVDINPDAVDGCKLALNLNIAKWALKARIEEFASTMAADASLPSQSASDGSTLKQPSAPEPALEGTSTPQTTPTSAKKRSAKRAAKNSESPTGIEPSASVQPNVHPEPDSAIQPDTLTNNAKNLAG